MGVFASGTDRTARHEVFDSSLLVYCCLLHLCLCNAAKALCLLLLSMSCSVTFANDAEDHPNSVKEVNALPKFPWIVFGFFLVLTEFARSLHCIHVNLLCELHACTYTSAMNSSF